MNRSTNLGPPKEELSSLTGLRFFLALWVILFHQAFFSHHSWISDLPETVVILIQAGYAAVGVFFVLSGFVLAYNYRLDKPWLQEQIRRYAAARFSRIYPAYAVALLLSAPWVMRLYLQNPSLATTVKETLRAILAWTLLQAWIPMSAEAWNGPGWSLSVEAFFYCCFPFLGVALWRCSRVRSLFAIAFLIWLGSLIAPAVAVTIPLKSDQAVPALLWGPASMGFWVNLVKFNPWVHIPEFCIGVSIGRAYYLLRASANSLFRKGYYFYVPGIMLEVAVILRYHSAVYLFLHNGLLLPLHALVILGFALDGGVLARILSIRPLALLGNASYAMYILQTPIGNYMAVIEKRIFRMSPSAWGGMALYVGVLIVLSAAFFQFIEEPLHRRLKGKMSVPSPGVLGREPAQAPAGSKVEQQAAPRQDALLYTPDRDW
jgi:peptidoglycan/LPS O-acetylase OafA/YrhL